MHILFSIPSGFHLREILLPLKPLIDQDTSIEKVTCLCPAAPFKDKLFKEYKEKYHFIKNPTDEKETTKLLDQIKPQLVVTNTSGLDSLDLPPLKSAQSLKIPTFTFISSWDNVWKMERLKNDNGCQILADTIVVWNPTMKNLLLKIFPTDPEKIKIIGAPRLDFFHHPEKIPTREQLFSHLGLDDPERKLIHLSSTELYPFDYVVKTISKAIDSDKINHHPYLYLSVHPGGDINRHKKYTQKYNVLTRYSFGRLPTSPHPNFLYNPTIKDVYLLTSLFVHSDLLINHSSTTAIESFLGHTPVININYGRPFDYFNWRRSMVYRDFKQHYQQILKAKATKIVKNPSELINAIKAYLNNPHADADGRQTALKNILASADKPCAPQILSLIKTSVGRGDR